MGKKRNMAKDATILVFVRFVTMLVSIIQTMVLTRILSKTSYGTYSQAILVISFLSPFFLWDWRMLLIIFLISLEILI